MDGLSGPVKAPRGASKSKASATKSKPAATKSKSCRNENKGRRNEIQMPPSLEERKVINGLIADSVLEGHWPRPHRERRNGGLAFLENKTHNRRLGKTMSIPPGEDCAGGALPEGVADADRGAGCLRQVSPDNIRFKTVAPAMQEP
jgi:hypothetical protein